jgi:hypothetical protein
MNVSPGRSSATAASRLAGIERRTGPALGGFPFFFVETFHADKNQVFMLADSARGWIMANRILRTT